MPGFQRGESINQDNILKCREKEIRLEDPINRIDYINPFQILGWISSPKHSSSIEYGRQLDVVIPKHPSESN